MDRGDLYNLTAFSMCAHNGTHIDAPAHFIRGGKSVDAIPLENLVGMAYVAEHSGTVTGSDAEGIIEKANKKNPEAAKRILIKGDVEVSEDAAEVFANREQKFMNAKALCQIMLDAQRKSYGDGLDPDCQHPYMWLCKSHYYGRSF